MGDYEPEASMITKNPAVRIEDRKAMKLIAKIDCKKAIQEPPKGPGTFPGTPPQPIGNKRTI